MRFHTIRRASLAYDAPGPFRSWLREFEIASQRSGVTLALIGPWHARSGELGEQVAPASGVSPFGFHYAV